MEKNNLNLVVVSAITSLVTIIAVSAIMYLAGPRRTQKPVVQEQPKQVVAQIPQATQEVTKVIVNNTTTSSAVVAYNCKSSGGSFASGKCTCQDSIYDESNGYCMTSFGIPGGDEGEVAKKLQSLAMLQNTIVAHNCEQSGGAYNKEECKCPKVSGDQMTYDSDTGYCMSAMGTAGGELGETERKLQELEMCKNQ